VVPDHKTQLWADEKRMHRFVQSESDELDSPVGDSEGVVRKRVGLARDDVNYKGLRLCRLCGGAVASGGETVFKVDFFL
jgi:hypothetical protein